MPRAQVAAPGGRLVVLKRFLDSQVPACRREIRILHRFSRACGVLPIEGFFVQANTSDVYVQLPYLEHGTLANYYDETQVEVGTVLTAILAPMFMDKR